MPTSLRISRSGSAKRAWQWDMPRLGTMALRPAPSPERLDHRAGMGLAIGAFVLAGESVGADLLLVSVHRASHRQRLDTVEYQCPLLDTLTRSVKVTGKVKLNDAVDYVGAGSYVDQRMRKSA